MYGKSVLQQLKRGLWTDNRETRRDRSQNILIFFKVHTALIYSALDHNEIVQGHYCAQVWGDH